MKDKSTVYTPPKLGFVPLSALVFSMMVGAGIFNIPQNMAAGAGLLPTLTAWIVTAVGMLFLLFTFKILSHRRPDLNVGIYMYAREGYGNFAGFLIAWGYWLCTCFANIAYAVMLNDTLGAFFPPLLRHSWPTALLCTALIWGMCFVVIRGLRTAKFLTTSLSVIKVVAILLIIILMGLNIHFDNFRYAFSSDIADFSTFGFEVKNTMMVTLWCFIGIEGAVMMSGRAKRPKVVGTAGISGFLIAWLLYVAVSIFSFGIMHRTSLENLPDPSVAYVLKSICGDWGFLLVLCSVIISIVGGWVAWTLVCGEVPYEAARSHIFPEWFGKANRFGMPARGLVTASIIMTLFLFLVLTAEDVYLAALNITGMMILPAYLMAGLYLTKISGCEGELGCVKKGDSRRCRTIGLLCTAFCLWMIYAGGLNLMLLSSIFYATGLCIYIYRRPRLNQSERRAALILIFLALLSLGLLFTGRIAI